MGTTKKRAIPDRYDTRWTETEAHLWRNERGEGSQEYLPVSAMWLGFIRTSNTDSIVLSHRTVPIGSW